MKKDRLNKILVDRGLAKTRKKARAMIMAGLGTSCEERIDKPVRIIPADLPPAVREPLYLVGQGGLMLEEALGLLGVDVRGRICADIGSSTGRCPNSANACGVTAGTTNSKTSFVRIHSFARLLPH